MTQNVVFSNVLVIDSLAIEVSAFRFLYKSKGDSNKNMQNMSGGKTAFGLDANIGALLCYVANFIPCCLPLGLIYSIIVIVQDKTNKLARFHAFQSILLSVIGILVGCVVYAFVIVGAIANSGVLMSLFSLVASLVGLVVLIAIIFCAIKAFQGQMFKLPVIGDMADKWSD